MFNKITENLAIGSITETEQLQEVKQQGYNTVIDLCSSGEGNQLDSQTITDIGFHHANIPVTPQTLNQDTLNFFMEKLDNLPQPSYIRCASGLRAGVFTLLTLANKENWTEEKYLEEFAKLDLPKKQIIMDFAHNYFQK
ncbi:Zn-dependent hydrolase [Cyanobacterium sp. HL-69]|uniref:hypothetical protein n=1 Tax=Cyanobacterium sp. HL-69 TaxID=2054282 RepID=UPI000CA0DE53|nr:Zn-dependent hydrolase [Cyanobacterium sp. HL-69]